MRSFMTITALALLLTASSGVQAQDRDEADRSPGALAAEGLATVLQALDLFIQSIPQYEPPELTEEGDIILRRKREEAEPVPQPPSRSDDRITI